MSILWLTLAAATNQADLDLVYATQSCRSQPVRVALAAGGKGDEEAFVRPPYKRGFWNSFFPPKRRWTTPIHEATRCALRGYPGPLDVLLQADTPVAVATQDRATPLHLALAAAGEGDRDGVSVTSKLLGHDASPWLVYGERSALEALYDPEGPRHRSQRAAEEALVAAGVPGTELLCAAAHQADVRAVVDAPGDADGTCVYGSPLLAATMSGSTPTAQAVLDRGAAVDARSRRALAGTWTTPVHQAVAAGDSCMLAALLHGGASPDLSATPDWNRPVPPLEVALRDGRVTMVEALVGSGASRAVWVPPATPHEPWRSVFAPGHGLPDLRGDRPLDSLEESVAEVSAYLHDPDWAVDLERWGPQGLSQLATTTSLDLPPIAVWSCSPAATARGLRQAHGRPERTEGRWVQRWTFDDGTEALMTRERRPGRWVPVRHTGEGPCDELVGHTVAEALLRLGPPEASGAGRMRWRGLDGEVELMVSAGGVVEDWVVRPSSPFGH